MREIKFRGKNKKSWHYGMLTYVNFNQGVEKAIAVKTELGSIFIEKIDKNTIGQFTGLYDKNRKEIYEGDILKLYDKKYDTVWYAKVEFGNPYGKYSWGWEFVYIKGDKVNTECLLWVDMEEVGVFCEVIGNIYDNAELIKE